MKSKKTIMIVLALMLAACLSAAALAESPNETTAADAAKAAADAAQEAADAAQAESAALAEALEAYGKAKAEGRKLAILTSLKEELDGYVAAGSLTQEQADLILNYYAEQLALAAQNGNGFGRDSKGGRGTNGFVNGPAGRMNPGSSFNGRNNVNGQNDFGGRHGRFNNTVPTQPSAQEAPAAPEVPADPEAPAAPEGQGANNT